MQVLIGSEITKYGINLENVQEMIIISPSWNYGDIFQASHRVLRAYSHIGLLRESSGKKKRVDVRIHKLCAIPQFINDRKMTARQLAVEATRSSINGNIPSIDIQMYLQSEYKETDIQTMLSMMKIYAIDCPLNKRRNRQTK